MLCAVLVTLNLLCHIPLCAEDPGICSVLWEERQPLAEPLRALINDTASVFPAVPGPYLRLLAATAHGPYAAAAAYAHLQVREAAVCGQMPATCVEHGELAYLQAHLGGSVVLMACMPWLC
jgi:hypothetical protein